MSKKDFKTLNTASTNTSCSKCVDGDVKCLKCAGFVVKNGKTAGGKQRYLCRNCRETKVRHPVTIGFGKKHDEQAIQLKIEGCGVRSIGRILNISGSSVIRIILRVASKIETPKITTISKVQVDEIHTFIGSKTNGVYVIYSWDQESKRALSLAVGTRSKANLSSVVNPLLEAGIESINTDRYSGYKGVVPKKLHTTFKRRNNGIERQNLNLRTHLKRLKFQPRKKPKYLSLILESPKNENVMSVGEQNNISI